MPIYSGNNNILDIYVGNSRCVQAWFGNDLVWQVYKRIFSSNTAGTSTVNVPAGKYHIVIVGGGGGGSSSVGGAGAYFEGTYWLPATTITITVGSAGYGGGAYCRNNNGGSGGNSVVSCTGFSVTAPGGRYGCGRRNECGAGLTYAPSQSISVSGTRTGVSTQATRQNSWYGGYGAGGGTCDCDTCAGKAGGAGYVLIERV